MSDADEIESIDSYMNVQSHWYMSKLIIREVNRRLPIHISETPFVAGSILADYSLITLRHKHLTTRSLDFVKESIHFMTTIGPEFEILADNYLVAYHLGIITHYICDFFCEAHSGETFGNTREHMQYEDFLDNYRYTHAAQLEKLDWTREISPMRSPEEINDFLDRELAAYRNRGQSVRRDLELAIGNSIAVLYSMAVIRLTQMELLPSAVVVTSR